MRKEKEICAAVAATFQTAKVKTMVHGKRLVKMGQALELLFGTVSHFRHPLGVLECISQA